MIARTCLGSGIDALRHYYYVYCDKDITVGGLHPAR